MKLSKTQQRVYDEAKRTIEVIKKYETFEEFFDNSRGEQNQLKTAWGCNNLYNSSEKYKARKPEGWREIAESFYRIKNDSVLLVRAKTETINALVNAGLFEIVEAARYEGGCELVKVL